MKQKLLRNMLVAGLIATVFITCLQSCNKEIPGAALITSVQNSITINGFLTTDTSYSMLNAAVIKAGLTSLLADSTSSVTLFAPNNAAFRIYINLASGGAISINSPNATFISFINNTLTAAQIVPLISYLIIPGHEFVFSEIPTTFPNIQLPSAFTISVLPGTTIPIKLPVFPSRRTGTNVWLNTIPVATFDSHYRNGVVHAISAGIPTPPSITAWAIMQADTQDTLFRTLVARGDSGQVGLNRIDSVLNYAVVNVTAFVPSSTAIKTLINALSGGAVPLAAPTSTFIGFINSANVSAQTAKGIVVYHLLADFNSAGVITPLRAFSVNFTTTATFYKTLFNGAPGASAHPGIKVQATFSGQVVTAMQLTGYGNIPPGGTPYTSTPANTTALDKHGINGVVHNIDKVLLPQ